MSPVHCPPCLTQYKREFLSAADHKSHSHQNWTSESRTSSILSEKTYLIFWKRLLLFTPPSWRAMIELAVFHLDHSFLMYCPSFFTIIFIYPIILFHTWISRDSFLSHFFLVLTPFN